MPAHLCHHCPRRRCVCDLQPSRTAARALGGPGWGERDQVKSGGGTKCPNLPTPAKSWSPGGDFFPGSEPTAEFNIIGKNAKLQKYAKLYKIK